MIKRIDLIGVPGVGKSTILRELKTRRNDNSWCTTNEVVKEILNQHFKKKRYSVQDLILRFSSFFHPSKTYVPVNQDELNVFYSKQLSKDYLIIEKCLQSLLEDQETDSYLKAKRLSFLIDTLEDLKLINHFSSSNTILCDESLSAKLFSFVFDVEQFEDQKSTKTLVSNYLPNGFILMESDENDILKRLKSRNRRTTALAGLDDEKILEKLHIKKVKFKKAAELLMNLNVKGLIIDTSVPVKESVAKVENFMFEI